MAMHTRTDSQGIKHIRLDRVEDVVAYIGATCAKVIIEQKCPGHDSLETVAPRILSDACLDMIRTTYVRKVDGGMPTKQALTETGVALISAYKTKAGISAKGE